MLDSLPSFSQLWNNKKSILILLLVICLFVALSIYYYKRIVQPKLNQKYVDNKEFIQDNGSDGGSSESATLYFFYTTWCPHCKVARPEWKSLQTVTQGVVKGVNIVFKDIDCDQDADTANKFDVTGYPTIKLVHNNKIYDYDAKPNKDTLLQFLNSVLK